jgi:hypothetical protein
MSAWGIVPVSLVALAFLMLPLLMAQASRRGRMAGWDERVRRWDERAARRAEEWAPPWWYPPAVGSTFVLLGLVAWLLTHHVAQAVVAVAPGIAPTVYAVVTRRQAGGKYERSSHD